MKPNEFECKFIGKNHRKIFILFDNLTKKIHYLIIKKNMIKMNIIIYTLEDFKRRLIYY